MFIIITFDIFLLLLETIIYLYIFSVNVHLKVKIGAYHPVMMYSSNHSTNNVLLLIIQNNELQKMCENLLQLIYFHPVK